ncbi:MAG: response regulator [Nitrosomonadales bacterium]|nr:response regulator [Nitrosomonadales bacterium]
MPHRNSIKTLLIVDDSRVSRMMIRAFVLAKHPQWIVIEAVSGNEALEIVDRDTPNYCTMDINMPGLIGTEAAAQILAKYPGIRIAIFSSNIQEAHRTRAAALGARFVAKPVTERTVAQALEFFESQT